MRDLTSKSSPERTNGDRAVLVAESVRKDFLGLIAIIDRELQNGSRMSAGIAEARTAAERGLRLSEELVALLRRAGEAACEQVESPRGFRR